MEQDWQAISLDKKKRFGGGSLEECLFSQDSLPRFDAILRRPSFPDQDIAFPPFAPGELYRAACNGNPAKYFPPQAPVSASMTLINLPVEIVHEVYSHIELLLDIACLSITCQVLYKIGLAAESTWAGDRIICAGEFLANEDIPAGILTAAETAELEDSASYLHEDVPCQLFYLPYPKERTKELPFTMQTIWTVHCPFSERSPSSTVDEGDVLRDLCWSTPLPSAVAAATSSLRNLSRKEYVRESALRDMLAKYTGTNVLMTEVGLGQVAVIRICFSSDDSGTKAYDAPIHQGVWAGDRLDIVDGLEWLDGVDSVLPKT
ncbi:hypothetical protein C8J57DRAFT_1465345 [Mycena rebaudengoi]|nr:hypothetical protein C8J57DRAFT_1465345 [Mycena rebaudengoi]